jgi:hypothetical protein
VSDSKQRAEELLRRAADLEARARERPARAQIEPGRDSLREGLEDVTWLARGIRRAARLGRETGVVLAQILRWTGPLWWVLRGLGAAVGFVAYRASHVRTSAGDYELSPRKAARSLMVLCAAPVVLYTVYNLSTRHSGVFLINDKHLVSGETDEYQMGGCWQRRPEQTSCERGEGEIVLIRPAWIPATGIFSVTYDEDVGVVPLQGKCELVTYGIYLRTPWLPFLRGALKPIAIEIGKCDGIAGAASGVLPHRAATPAEARGG